MPLVLARRDLLTRGARVWRGAWLCRVRGTCRVLHVPRGAVGRPSDASASRTVPDDARGARAGRDERASAVAQAHEHHAPPPLRHAVVAVDDRARPGHA